MIIKNIFNRYLVLALTLVFTSAAVWAAPGDVISFNFHQDDSGNKGPLVGDQVTLVGTIPAEHWNSNKKNIASGNWQNGSNSTTLVYNVNSNVGSECEATCVWTFSAAHFYGGAAANYSDENYFMKCIAAPQAGGGGTETLTISNIPFSKYYAVIYISNWDIGHNTSFKLGETNYSVSATGLAIPDSTADWGGTATSPVYGTNAVKIDNLSGDFSYSMTAAKCNVCAIQIVDDTAAKAGEEIVWSNLDSDAAKGTHFTKGNNDITLSISESESCASGTIIAITSVKFANKSVKTMQDTITINGQVSDTMTTDTSFAGNGDTSYNILHIYNFSTPPLVTIGEDYSIGTPGNNQLAAIQTDSPILIPGLASPWDAGYNAYCAVEGEVYAPAGYRVELEETELTLSDSTPVKAFSGINSLAMLKSKFDAGEVIAMIGGGWLTTAKNVQSFVLDTETDTTLSYQFQVDDDNYLKMVVVEFTVGADGIYAKQTAQGNVAGKGAELLGQKVLTSGGDYTFSGVGVADYTITSIAAPAVVKVVGDDKAEVEFTPANDEDWSDLILPTKAKGVAVAGNTSFASRSAYKQTLGGREATVALVTDAQTNNAIYGLQAINSAAGLGEIDRDIYLMVSGGTPGVVSGGEDAGWSATKTNPTGNVLVNVGGNTVVDYVYGAGLGGGTGGSGLAKIIGNVGVVVKDEAQVKGSIIGGWQSRHNAIPQVTGNSSILIQNIQTYAGDATYTASSGNCVQGWIAAGGIFMTNGGRSLVGGNTLVTIDIPDTESGEFMKHITAGGHAEGGGDGNNVTGNSSVVITAPDSVIFPKNIMGGGHSTSTNKAKVGGNSSLKINGGTYTGHIYAAGDNGEHTLVTGTATLTINGGDLSAATLKGGTATGDKILNLNGGKVALGSFTGFNKINVGSGFAFFFPDGQASGTANLLGCEALTYDGNTTGKYTYPADVMVGQLARPGATIELDLDNKTVKYLVDESGALTRRSDKELEDNGIEKTWMAPNSWSKNVDGTETPCNWVDGTEDVYIDADKVSKIVVDGVVNAGLISLRNSATEEGAEFRFETMESLETVGDMSITNPDYIIKGKVSAANFAGKLYLQSRIEDSIALGPETRVIFVAGIDENKSEEENAAEVTTAYSYTFTNRVHPIGKVGFGTFIVPRSMYEYPFNIDNGTISYNTPGEVNGVVTCQNEGIGQIAVNAGEGNSVTISADNSVFTGSVLIKSGTLKMGHNKCLGAYGVNRAIRVKTGAALDMNGMSNGYREAATYCLTLEEGATYKNSAAHHSDIKAAFPISKLVLEGDATINCDGFACGLALHYNTSTAIDLGEHTLEIIGNQPAYMSCPQVTGTGKILVTSGGLRLAHNSGAQPQIANGTLDIASGTVLTLETYTAGTKPVVKNLVLNGTVNCLSENCSITVNGLLSGVGSVGGEADGVGKLILGPEAKYDGSSLTPEFLTAAEVGQPLPLIIAKTSITYGAGFAAVNLPTGWEIYHTDTEIGIINTANGLILNSETLDLTDGHFQEIPLGPTHNDAKIKITRPAKFIKIAAVVEGVTSIPTGLTIIDENEEDITADCLVHDGVIYFGKLHSETEYTFTSEQLESFESGATGIMQDIDPMSVIAPTELTFTNLPENALAKIIDNRLLLIKKTNSISIKFGPRGATEGHIGELDENVGGFPVMGMFWNHSKDYNNNNAGTTEIFKVKDGNGEILADTRVFYYCPNTYSVNSGNNHQTTGNGKLTYSYIDDTERLSGDNATAALTITQDVDGTSETRVLKPTPTGKLFWEVGISDVPYQIFDLYIYQASDQTDETISLLPIGVKANDGDWKYFAGDGKGSTIAATADTRWNGAAYCDSETMVEGTNYIRYRMSAAALGLAAGTTIENIYLTYPDKSNGRLGLAGIQLVEVEDDGLYTRQADPADMGGDDDERNVWTRENSWKKSNGSVINWPTEGERNVTINADEVKAIKINDVITANGVTVKNSDTSYTLDEHEFKFLTLEDLGDVATPNDNPDYILNAPVDATGFCGDLYLQSRISGMVSLGANTHITFVAMNEGEETTAYPYNFSGTINPIRKIGRGTFIVPGSMYNVGFNIAEGFLRFNDNGTYTGTITGNKPVIVTASDFKMNSASQFNEASEVVVKEGASFDQNGLSGGSTTILTLDGGSFVNNKAVNGLNATYSNHAYPIKTLKVTKDSTIGGTQHFGLVGGQWSAVTMNMSNDVTLSKTGTNVFAVVNLTINGNGTIDVQGGTFATRRSAVSATDATIIVHDGATLDVGSDLSVGTLAGDGALVGSGRLSVKAIDTTKGSDIITIPEGFNIDLPDILTAVVNDDSAPILNGITEGFNLPTYIQIKTNGQPMKYHPVVRDGMLYAEKINVEGILIPTIEHTTVTVKADGQLVEPDSDNMISVMEGTKLEVTYTAEEGYYIKNGTISFVVLSSKDNTIDISKVIVSDQPLTIIPIVLIETKGTKLWIKNGIVDEEGLAIEGDTLTVHAELRAGYSSLALTVNDTPVTLNGSGDAEITVLAPATFIKTTCTKNN